jgi:shikimate 5-dehydrogenase
MSSLSPALQEDAFAAAGIRGHYHLMDLDRLPGRRLEHLMAAVKAAASTASMSRSPARGGHAPAGGDIGRRPQIGAVNCVTIANDGRTVGYNTIASAFGATSRRASGAPASRARRRSLIGPAGPDGRSPSR